MFSTQKIVKFDNLYALRKQIGFLFFKHYKYKDFDEANTWWKIDSKHFRSCCLVPLKDLLYVYDPTFKHNDGELVANETIIAFKRVNT